MPQQSKKWILRSREDQHILGPFESARIKALLTQGHLTGDEFAAVYPGGDWMPMSQVPELYDLVLEVLSGTEKVQPSRPKLQVVPKPPVQEPTPKAQTQTKTNPLPPPNFSANTTSGTRTTQRPLILEAREVKSGIQIKKVLPLLFIGAAVLLLFYAFQDGGPGKGSVPTGQRISLIEPSLKGGRDSSAAQGYIKEGWQAFLKDSSLGYLEAQEKFVKAIEAYNPSGEAQAMLLMTYLYLWPFAKQDGQDQLAIQHVFQQLTKTEPFGARRAVGAAAYNLLMARDSDARGILDTALNESPSEGRLYALRGHLLFETGNFSEASAYFEKAKQLYGQWSRPQYQMALCFLKLGDYVSAAKYFVSTLNQNPRHHWSRLELGILEAQNFNHPDKAQAYLVDALESGERFLPSSEGRARYLLAVLLSKSGDTKRAIQEAQIAQKLLPNDSDIQIFLDQAGGTSLVGSDERSFIQAGDQYMRSRNYLGAQAQYKAAFEANPKNARAAYKVAEALWKLYQSGEAIAYLKRAIAIDPKDIPSHLLLAEYYTQKHEYALAATSLESAQKINPRSHEVLRSLAEYYLKRGDPRTAETYAGQALKIYDTDMRTNHVMAQIQLAKKEILKAQQYAKKAMDLDKASPEPHLDWAKVLLALQNGKQAADYLVNMINTYPTVVEYRLGLAEIYLHDEQYSAAQKVLEQVIHADSNNKQAYLLLGSAFFLNNDGERALANFLAAAKLDLSDPEGLYRAGEVYLKANRPQDAQRQFSLVLRANSNFPLAHYSLARAYQAMSEGDMALKEIELEKKLNPNLPEAYELAGDIYLGLKRFPDAAKEFQKVTTLKPDTGAAIYIKLARAFRNSGNFDAALSMLRLASTKESGLAEIYREQGAIFDLKGLTSEALESYKQYLNLEPNAVDKEQVQARIKHLE